MRPGNQARGLRDFFFARGGDFLAVDFEAEAAGFGEGASAADAVERGFGAVRSCMVWRI